MDAAVRFLHKSTACPIAQALEAASLRPAEILGIQNKKGTLDIGADADLLILDNDLHLKAT